MQTNCKERNKVREKEKKTMMHGGEKDDQGKGMDKEELEREG